MRRRTLLQTGASALALPTLASTVTATTGTQTEPFGPLDTVEIPGTREAAVHHDGEVAYVAANTGFAVVDISDPASLEVLAERRGIDLGGSATLGTLWDLWPWEDRLVVSGPAQPNPGSAQGFALFDISDPANPEQVASHETGWYIHNCYFEDGVVYLSGSGLFQAEGRIPLVMYDVTDDDPEEVGRWSPVDHDEAWGEVPIGQRVLHDVYVQDGVAYLPYWDSGTWLVDVSDPAGPEVLDRVGDYTREDLVDIDLDTSRLEGGVPPGNAHYAEVDEDGSLLAVGEEAWSFDTSDGVVGGAGGVDLYDVSDKRDVEHLTHIDPPESYEQRRGAFFTTSHNCDIVGDRLYTSWYFGGVKLHDISDPSNPEELAWWRDPREASFWTAQAGVPGEFFVGSSADPPIEPGAREPVGEGLYTFPDHPGEQPDAPDLTRPPAELLSSDGNGGENGGSDGSENGGNDGSENGGNDGSENGGNDGGNGSENGGDDGADDSADDDGPGFGVGGAITAVGGAGYLLARRLRGDEKQ
jgi:PGF-CTERM protein